MLLPWDMHAGLIGLDGEKMSKSRGNLAFLSKLVGQGADPLAVRLALMSHPAAFSVLCPVGASGEKAWGFARW